ncbi:MAG: U32 family peptidase, partial [Lachnospiraceae bacterium]|nr:U32 family peptidase [Lachnospiraceae bacterium]
MNKVPELLCPAGSFETMQTAILYGADAVYMGGDMFGLRAKAKNFDREQMREAVTYAHERGVRVHVTVNIIAHNQHLDLLEEYLLFLREIGADALIMADAGMIAMARAIVPDMEIHLSTQASATNYATFNFWHQMGVKRVVAAREVSLRELKEIREHTDPGLTIEAFAHGAMC